MHIVLKGQSPSIARINQSNVVFSPAAPHLSYKNDLLSWTPVPGAVKYQLLENGKLITETSSTSFKTLRKGYREYQVIAVDKNGISSFASEPLELTADMNTSIYEMENYAAPATYSYKGYSGKGFVETAIQVNTLIKIPVSVKEEGDYAVDIRYSNGNGPVNTENKCAIRSLSMNGDKKGVLVFPQRGKGEWSNWGWSNSLQVHLAKGEYIVTIEYLPENENMNGETNQAMLDQLRLIKK